MPIYEKLMGNPFVDAGVCGICEWLGRSVQPEQITKTELRKIVEDVVPIMRPFDKKRPEAHGWKNWVSIFTTNHPLTQPSKKGDRVVGFKEKLLDYVNSSEDLNQTGNCMGCGRRNANAWLSRTGVPLTGSGKLRNFFPNFTEGAAYCSACAFAIQLSPLTFVASGGRFLMLHSNSWIALRNWGRICVGNIRQQELQQEITGCYNPGYVNPRNGLFYMTQRMIDFLDRREVEAAMQVYNFTNFGQGPKLEIFYMPARVFRFLRIVYQSEFKNAWRIIVRSAYMKVNWDKVKSEEDYKNRKNRVYEYLLQERSILTFFLNRRSRKTRGNWELLSLYLKEVRTMEQKQLEKIKQVGDLISDCIKKSGRDRRLRQLEMAKNYGECRNILRYVIRDRIQQGAPEPLFSIDDYMEHLFPVSEDFAATPWRETRDLILFRIYETLHGWLQDQGFVDFDDNDTLDADDASEGQLTQED